MRGLLKAVAAGVEIRGSTGRPAAFVCDGADTNVGESGGQTPQPAQKITLESCRRIFFEKITSSACRTSSCIHLG